RIVGQRAELVDPAGRKAERLGGEQHGLDGGRAVEEGVHLVALVGYDDMAGRAVEVIGRAAVVGLGDRMRQRQALVRAVDGSEMPQLFAVAGRRPQAGLQDGFKVLTADLLAGKRAGRAARVDCGEYFVHRAKPPKIMWL